MVSLSNDTVAVLDQQAIGSAVRFFDTAQGRPVGEPFTHNLEVKEICLSQVGSPGGWVPTTHVGGPLDLNPPDYVILILKSMDQVNDMINSTWCYL